jgi:hypothetical protein
LQTRTHVVGVGIRILETQALDGKSRATEAAGDLRLDFIVRENDDFHICIEQGLDDVALQKVDNCHTMVGRNEDFFGH